MSCIQLVCLCVIVSIGLSQQQILGRHDFENEPENRCITPNRKPGHCVILTKCPLLFNVFKMKPLDDATQTYLKGAFCRHENNVPVVCCETDAGACTTAENKPGACVPLKRCDAMLSFIDRKPFLSDHAVRYLRQSECQYGSSDQSRVCCPLFKHHLITGQVVGEVVTRSPIDTTPITVSSVTPATPTPTPVTPIDRVKVEPKVKLPTPGEVEGNCGVSEIGERIIGGNRTDIYDYPWMALLRMGDGEFACGGSLIHPRYVLTAAHCVKGPKVERRKNLASIRLGEWDTKQDKDCVQRSGFEECSHDPVDIDAEEIIPHPGFSILTLQNDIALVRLKKPAPFTEFIRPICLSLTPLGPPTTYHVAGWGRTEISLQSNVKLYLPKLPHYDKENCTKKYSAIRTSPQINLGPGQFCAGGVEAQDTCTGDSGGPAMTGVRQDGQSVVFYQVGIVSFGPQLCGLEDRPGVYTKVDHYYDWMFENMRP